MTITLENEWTFRNATITIVYPAGSHEVSDEIHAAAVAEGVTNEGAAKAPEKGATGKA